VPAPLPPRYDNRPDQLALDDVNLVLQPGRLTALVGLSGSGKTTLVSLLQRHYDPTGGQVLVDGSDLREVRGAEGG
jgi:ABC-type multidrug transport system fused ATPase/permease subunit